MFSHLQAMILHTSPPLRQYLLLPTDQTHKEATRGTISKFHPLLTSNPASHSMLCLLHLHMLPFLQANRGFLLTGNLCKPHRALPMLNPHQARAAAACGSRSVSSAVC